MGKFVLGKDGKPVKKWKGKKKVRNLEEKKAKGLSLNAVDRKKIVKLQEKKKLKELVNKQVRDNLDQIRQEHDEEERSVSSMSESSFGSVPPPKKKRVSFSSSLEHRKVFDKNDKNQEFKASTASPGRGILKEKKLKKKKADKEKKKAKISEGKVKIAVKEARSEEEESLEVDDKENDSVVGEGTIDGGIKKAKKKIQVPKKLKEQLLAMPKKERKKALRELKAKKRPHLERGQEAKLLWEKIRSGKTPKEEKEKTIEQLVNLVKGNCKHLIYAHDTSRVIECLIALNRQPINSLLFDELAPEIIRMAKSKYARFFVTKMLKYGSKHQREQVITAFRGHCVSLLRIVWAAEVLETAYNDYASPQQRFDIVSEFYGKEFVLFRTDTARCLYDIITAEPAKKKLIVKHLEEIIVDVVGKTTLKHSLTHKLMLDLMEYGDKEQKENLIDSIKDKLPELVHTPEGSRVAMHCIWNANVKDRKLMVKNFKDLAVKAACEKYGCRVLMVIFDTVDDTVLVNKFITQELANNIGKVVNDKWGVSVAHYLVHPRDGRVLDRDIIHMFAQGDNNEHSKKAASERYSELFRCIAKPLFTFMAANMEQLLFERVETANLVLDSLEPHGHRELFTRVIEAEDRIGCYSAIKDIAAKEFIPCDTDNAHIIEHGWASFVLSQLLKGDANFPEAERLSTILADLPSEQIAEWIGCNKGCFVLLRMFENGNKSVQAKVASSVNMNRLSAYTSTGGKILHGKLSGRK